ncbi:hypothetical protein [Embleya sp. NPDC059237]|uniref:hypothetical protein n=1 Tax=Embleya sp. NPDC059237 TaxID=3346784 RepID=UPI00369A5DBC
MFPSSGAAIGEALLRAGLTLDDLAKPCLFVGDSWSDEEPATMLGRLALDRLGLRRADVRALGPNDNDVLPLLCTLVRSPGQDPPVRHSLLLVPEISHPTPGRDCAHLTGATAVLFERHWPHNRLKSIVTTRSEAPRVDDFRCTPQSRQSTTVTLPARRIANVLTEGPGRLPPHPGHHRKSEDRPPSPVCALVGKALRAAHTPWGTIAGLLIGLKDVLERDPEPGTRVLLISFDSDHHGSAGVLEV